MKNFYKKYEDSIIIMINVMLIILGFITKKAELKALRAEQKRLNRGKKKKKKNKKRK